MCKKNYNVYVNKIIPLTNVLMQNIYVPHVHSIKKFIIVH